MISLCLCIIKNPFGLQLAISNSYKGFVSKLEAKGYYVSENEDTGLVIERNNSYQVVRPQELFGDNYSKEKIINRIENKNYNILAVGDFLKFH